MHTEINDKLDLLIALVAKDCCEDDVKMFDSLDTSNVVFDKRFYRKKARIVRQYRHGPTARIVKRSFVRVAVALLVLLSLTFTTIMAVPTLREALLGAVVDWYENYLTVQYDSGKEDEPTPVANAPTPPTSIEEVRKPTDLPEGMVEDFLVQNKTSVCIDYYLNNEWVYTFRQELLDDGDKYIDNEAAILATVNIHGNLGTLVQQNEDSNISLVWADGQYMYTIYTYNKDTEALIAFAKSVR